MATRQREGAEGAWRYATAAAFTGAAAWVSALAVTHMITAWRMGPICGAPSGELVHCWACSAAPPLVAAALIAWRLPRVQMARIHVGR